MYCPNSIQPTEGPKSNQLNKVLEQQNQNEKDDNEYHVEVLENLFDMIRYFSKSAPMDYVHKLVQSL